ncbi:hypothetical protein EVAR_37045_1 [Eumeta japonica]|uniref:Uncharacterized protein n=1 Tax=Eumeta variegata TaxID=151549 RepID=A0A4C1WGJ3_EUMVA|nr:hypothetical protein EVAR_37045_1 [Eumeta japonica]
MVDRTHPLITGRFEETVYLRNHKAGARALRPGGAVHIVSDSIPSAPNVTSCRKLETSARVCAPAPCVRADLTRTWARSPAAIHSCALSHHLPGLHEDYTSSISNVGIDPYKEVRLVRNISPARRGRGKLGETSLDSVSYVSYNGKAFLITDITIWPRAAVNYGHKLLGRIAPAAPPMACAGADLSVPCSLSSAFFFKNRSMGKQKHLASESVIVTLDKTCYLPNDADSHRTAIDMQIRLVNVQKKARQVRDNAQNSATVKLATKTSQATRERRRKGRKVEPTHCNIRRYLFVRHNSGCICWRWGDYVQAQQLNVHSLRGTNGGIQRPGRHLELTRTQLDPGSPLRPQK